MKQDSSFTKQKTVSAPMNDIRKVRYSKWFKAVPVTKLEVVEVQVRAA